MKRIIEMQVPIMYSLYIHSESRFSFLDLPKNRDKNSADTDPNTTVNDEKQHVLGIWPLADMIVRGVDRHTHRGCQKELINDA
jgi:hypothetical protein